MIRKFKILKKTPNINFINYMKFAFVFSIILSTCSIGIYFFNGLNLGIDFKGGIIIEAKSNNDINISNIRKKLNSLNLGDLSIQSFGSKYEILIRVQRQEGDEKKQINAINIIKNTLGKNFEIRRTEFVGPTIGSELTKKGIYAVISALLAIMLYIWFRFEWQFSLSAIVALTHDVFSTIGLFALTQFEFNLSTIAAILTIAGYSINDTVVVFDRVRENLRRYKSWQQAEILNRSLNETLSRTLITSITTALALISIIFFGGEILKDFAIAMLWGVLIGTYSSIFISVGLISNIDLKKSEEKNDVEFPENEKQ